MKSEYLMNLQRIGQLDEVPVSEALLQKLLKVANTRLLDARRTDNSLETRFDCAYTAIRALADAALLKQGLRTSSSKPGHHQTALHCLEHTLGVQPMTVRVLDGLRKQRNLSDYDGESITRSVYEECIAQAEALLALTNKAWLDREHLSG